MQMFDISYSDYVEAVEQLLELAAMDCNSSTVAASVLLSTYNGGVFQVSIPDLGSLDNSNRMAAYTVMEGRCGPMNTEPHNIIENGRERFARLWEKYQHLQVVYEVEV